MAGDAANVAVRTERLGREYGELVALDKVTFELAEGRSLAILGPNGAGKSTLVRILAGLLRPTSGKVRVLDADLPGENWKLRGRVGYLGHRPMLYRDLTIAENLDFHARLHRIGDAADRIGELLDQVGLRRRADELVANLSAGMLHRADIARLLLPRPEILLLDEPLSNLDPAARDTLGAMLADQPVKARLTVSHEPERAAADHDEVLLIGGDGRVSWQGPAGEYDPDAHAGVYAGALR